MKKLVSSNLRKFTPLILTIIALWVVFLILFFPSIKKSEMSPDDEKSSYLSPDELKKQNIRLRDEYFETKLKDKLSYSISFL